MTVTEKLEHKKNVHATCVAMLASRITICTLAIDNAQQASNDDQKSSAGDKFETSRAMNHLEKEMYGKQLQSNLTEQAALQSVNFDTLHDRVKTGSYIECKNFDLYIASGLGKTTINARLVYLLSPDAPLAGMLRQKRKGDVFVFNKMEAEILDIY